MDQNFKFLETLRYIRRIKNVIFASLSEKQLIIAAVKQIMLFAIKFKLPSESFNIDDIINTSVKYTYTFIPFFF